MTLTMYLKNVACFLSLLTNVYILLVYNSIDVHVLLSLSSKLLQAKLFPGRSIVSLLKYNNAEYK